jgi:hypothetical protein
MVDLSKEGSSRFLGSTAPLSEAVQKIACPRYLPRLTKRTALLTKLKILFRRYFSQLERVIPEINRILRGSGELLCGDHSGQWVSFISRWVDRNRRPLVRARDSRGSGGSGGAMTGGTTRLVCFMTIACVGSEPDGKRPHRKGRITLVMKHGGKPKCGKSARWVWRGGDRKPAFGLTFEALSKKWRGTARTHLKVRCRSSILQLAGGRLASTARGET